MSIDRDKIADRRARAIGRVRAAALALTVAGIATTTLMYAVRAPWLGTSITLVPTIITAIGMLGPAAILGLKSNRIGTWLVPLPPAQGVCPKCDYPMERSDRRCPECGCVSQGSADAGQGSSGDRDGSNRA
jgi:hypothetical protein